MRSTILAMSVTALVITGCQRDSTGTSPEAKSGTNKPSMSVRDVLKITVSAGGDLKADGQPITFEQLAIRLADLKKANGEVWYHRENPQTEPHPNGMKVMALVIENKLPIKLSAMPDFSDSVDDKGRSRPDGG